jgi:hypothetical protein
MTNLLRPRHGALALLAGAALLVAGCGSGSSSQTVASVTTTTTQPIPPNPNITTPLGHDVIKRTTHKPVRAHGIGKGPSDESSATGAKPVDPCTLVSRAEAQAFVHGTVAKPVEAPQGPTCIYMVKGAKSFITLAVELSNFSKIAPQSQLTGRTTLTVADHTAYCGKAGEQMMVVPLSAGRFLTIAASCPVATLFAQAALTRLES